MTSENFCQVYGQSVFDRLMGAPKWVLVPEADARHLRKGGYFEYETKVWKIVNILRPVDWTDTRVTLLLKNWTNQGILSTTASKEKIVWLEDEFLPGRDA